jgi:hypothetical protein
LLYDKSTTGDFIDPTQDPLEMIQQLRKVKKQQIL